MAIEVAGYNVNSFDVLDQPSFLQAEIIGDRQVLASTGDDGSPFEATLLRQRVQKVQRYSFQRPFMEVYELQPDCHRWRTDRERSVEVAPTSAVSPKKLCPRRVPYPAFEMRRPLHSVSKGRMTKREEAVQLWKDRSLVNIGPQLKGYPEDQLETIPTVELQNLMTVPTADLGQPYECDSAVPLTGGEFQIFDLGVNRTGMPGAQVLRERDSALVRVR